MNYSQIPLMGKLRTPTMTYTFQVGLASVFLWFMIPCALAQTPNTCLDCHSALDAPLNVSASEFSASIHPQK